jgi:cell division protein FtsW
VRYSRNCVILATLALTALGLVMVYSSSAVRAELLTGDAGWMVRKQLVFVLVGLLAGVVLCDLDYRRLLRHAPWIYGGTLALLALVLLPVFGEELNGARRWLRLPGRMTLQVSDLAKVAVLLTLCTFLAHRGEGKVKSLWGGTLPGLGLILLPCMLILPEPDLGTTVFVGLLGVTLLFLGGMPWRHLLPALALAPLVVLLAYHLFPHVQSRLHTFLDPEGLGSPGSYQVRQALIALGSGGLIGTGLGDGNLKLFGVPEAGSDFIFAIVGEEIGLVGTLGVLLLFGIFAYHGWRISQEAVDGPGRLLAMGVVVLVGLQACINIAVVTACLPNKGIPLPFISAGGTSVIVMLAATGLLLSVANVRLRGAATLKEKVDG